MVHTICGWSHLGQLLVRIPRNIFEEPVDPHKAGNNARRVSRNLIDTKKFCNVLVLANSPPCNDFSCDTLSVVVSSA